jgi:two-component system CheB/CheR fusion protein
MSSQAVSEPTRIVGIGASAGGLESLEQLFAALPGDTTLAFVVVQHLSPDFKSMMDELIGRHTTMPVVVARDGLLVEAGHVYVLPPRKEMIISERTLRLTDKDANAFSRPIDQFFRSLAQDAGAQAVGVILSGSGSDGARGVVEIRDVGGLVFAETTATARFDGMPLAATGTGAVHHTNTPGDIARILCGLAPIDPLVDEPQPDDDPALAPIFRMLRDAFGIDFSLYKTSTVARRIQRRVNIVGARSTQAYLESLSGNADELDALYQDLLIGVTQFFRDPPAFELLAHDVMPKLLERVPPDQELRIWVAGCATGEEAYSIAMIIYEQLAARERPINVKILATDVHQQSLDHASAGIYGEAQLSNVEPHRLERFFVRRSSGYQIVPELRSLVVFARHNVTRDAPFTRMHLISCRNLLIYLQPATQRNVLSLFHFGLVTHGALLLGPSESPGPLAEELATVDEHWKIYTKRRDVHLLPQVGAPPGRLATRRPGAGLGVETTRGYGPDPLLLATYDQLLDRFMPPGFVVDEDRNLIDTFAGAERLLRFPKRRPTGSLIDLLDGDLRSVVAGAIQRAIKDKAPIAYTGVKIPSEQGGEVRASLTAELLLHPRTNVRHILITFQQTSPELATEATPTEIAASTAPAERMTALEAELAYTRETLQSTIEELETSNEEIQASNEELVAANEELQSTNEELHSVNEELYTVNAEYQQKITELKEVNTDMAHLLEGTDVGTVFLDGELRIRRFTSRIARVFRFKHHDVGRMIGDFSHNIDRPALIEELARVRATGETVEAEVRDHDGTPYFLRILPYRISQRVDRPDEPPMIDGVVLTLTDITVLDKARSRLAQLSAIVESSDDAIVGKGLDGIIQTWNRGAERLYGYTAEEVVGKNVAVLMQPGSEHELPSLIGQISRGETVEHFRSLRLRKDGTKLDMSVTLSPIYDAERRIVGVSAIGRDVSGLVSAQRELEARSTEIRGLLEQAEDAARRREQFLAMLSHELRNPLAAVTNAAAVLRVTPTGEVIERCQRALERQSLHMKRLLDDLLDVSRITRGKFELRSADLDLRQPIDAAIEATAPLLAERGLVLRTSMPDGPLPLHGDVNRLAQVIANLLSNAANYSPSGSHAELRVDAIGQRIGIRVSDHGVGIEPELLDRIFELFVQSEQRLDRSRGGLGVGLSLARNIVELHNGTIAAHSDGPGRGSTFQIWLPRSATVATNPSARPRGGQRCRIVLVDDQEDSREMLRMLLQSRDHTVLDASDGETAIELIHRERPDVAFIDIGLPVMSGYEVAQRIRADAQLSRVHLVALTGYGAPADVSAALAAGFDEHLIKPADIGRLDQILGDRKPYVS